MGITIKELSEMSGFSSSTISRVLNNAGNVKENTRKEIEELLIEKNYRTNIMEIRKIKSKCKVILIVVGDLDNWFYMESIRGIIDCLSLQGYSVMIGYSDNNEVREEEYINIAFQQHYAGLIFMNIVEGRGLRKEITDVLPIVFLNRVLKFMDVDSVCSDNYYGGYIATKHLIQHGHRKIAHLTGSASSTATIERVRGYEDAMRDFRCVVTENSYFYGDLKRESGYEAGISFVKEGLDFTAIFCGNDLMAVGIMEAFEECGLSIPKDISVICYDNTLISQKAKIKLTTVGVDANKMGVAAAELLLDRINNICRDSKSILYKPKLYEGDSVGHINL